MKNIFKDARHQLFALKNRKAESCEYIKPTLAIFIDFKLTNRSILNSIEHDEYSTPLSLHS